MSDLSYLIECLFIGQRVAILILIKSNNIFNFTLYDFQYGKQLQKNYEKLRTEVTQWDTRDLRSSVSDGDTFDESLELNPTATLQDSRMSIPEPGSRHSIVHVQNSSLVRNSTGSDTTICESEDVVCLEVSSNQERKSSITGQNMYEVQRPVVKRVSFSNTHSVINAEGEEIVPLRHRDSITSSSTESSEDSISSGENRFGTMSRSSKMRAKIPLSTDTTRHMSEMYQQSMDGSSISSCESYGHERKSSLTSPVHSHSFTEKDRRKSAPMIHGEGKESRHERKSSDSSREFKVRSQSLADPIYENMHERKSSDDSREFRIHSRKSSSESGGSRHEKKSSSDSSGSRHERKGSDGSRELKVRSQIIPSEKGIKESRHERKDSDGSRELKVRSQAISNEHILHESQRERTPEPKHGDKKSVIQNQQLVTDLRRTGSPPPPHKHVQSYRRPQTPPPSRPNEDEIIKHQPFSSLPLPSPPREMSPTPSRERLSTPPPPPPSAITSMRERLTSPPPPPVQRVMSPPPPMTRDGPSHSRSSSSTSQYSNLSTEDHFPVPPSQCHKMSGYHPQSQPMSLMSPPMSSKPMLSMASMGPPPVASKPMQPPAPLSMMSPPMSSNQPPIMSPPAAKHFSHNSLPLSHPITSQMSPPVSSEFSTPPSPAPPAGQHVTSKPSNYPTPAENDSSPSTPKNCVQMPPAMPLLQNRYVGTDVGGLSPLRKSGPDNIGPKIGQVTPGGQKHRPSPLSCSGPAYGSQPSQSVLSPTMTSPDGRHFNSMTNSGPQFNGPYDQGYQNGPRVMSSSMPITNCSMIPQQSYPGKQGAIYDHPRNSHVTVPTSVMSSDDRSYPQQQQQSLPFLTELSQRPQKPPGKVPPATLPKPESGQKNIQKYNGANSNELGITSPIGPLRQVSCGPGKNIPPPPPRRSENTRLSTEIKSNSADIHCVPKYDPLFENCECEGLLDINDLPLPPPELLEGIGGGVPKKGKLPPPPPKRSSETQLTNQ